MAKIDGSILKRRVAHKIENQSKTNRREGPQQDQKECIDNHVCYINLTSHNVPFTTFNIVTIVDYIPI